MEGVKIAMFGHAQWAIFFLHLYQNSSGRRYFLSSRDQPFDYELFFGLEQCVVVLIILKV